MRILALNRRAMLFALLVFFSFILGAFCVSILPQPRYSAAESPGPQAQGQTGQGAALMSMGNPYLIADVAEQVSPAVVYIEAKWPARTSPPFAMEPFQWWFFFGFPFPPEGQERTSRGTGFIISEEGYILTNQHVVGNIGEAEKITVKLTVGDLEKELPAEIIGADYKLDLAVLKIQKPRELDKLPIAPLGDSDKSRPGEWVIAIGNPYGEQYEHTVTVGVLSAKGREIQVRDPENPTGARRYKNLMQTDAAINPGNSGGPLLNIKGEVIGINTAVNAQAQGIGFAIPINEVKEVLQQLINTGSVQRPKMAWVGITMQEVTERVQEYYNLPDTNGVVISQIVQNSPAHKAGLQVYDVIRKVNNVEVKDPNHFADLVREHQPGDRLMLVVVRRTGSQVGTLFIGLELGEWPDWLPYSEE